MNTRDGTPTWCVRKSHKDRVHGGTIYNNLASGLIWIENQVYLGVYATLMGKSHFEHWLWDKARAKTPHYHGDNIIFTADTHQLDYDGKEQTGFILGEPLPFTCCTGAPYNC